jgi:hypothetical protein
MTVTINGTTGIAGVDGSAGTPAVQGADSNTGMFFPAADTVAIATGGTEAMRVDSARNVGIGTSSPNKSGSSRALTVNAAAGYSALELASGDASRWYINSDGSATYDVTVGNQPRIFFVNGSERARIDSSGNLLVNTTTSNSNAFKFKTQAASDVCLGVASATSVSGALTLNAVNDANSANVPLDFRGSAIHASSGIATTATGANAVFSSGENNRFYRSTSALKYKQDIRDLESIDIGKFRPVRYKSKCENDDQTKDHFGFIADEVASEGFEELVSRGVDGEAEGFQYDRMTVVLVKAIQEQQALITSLTARIAALEGAAQ